MKVVSGLGSAIAAWTDAAAAKGEQVAASIRSTTEARTQVMKGLVSPSLSAAIGDPQMISRAVDHLVADQLGKQANREAVAREAVELLNEAPKPGRTDQEQRREIPEVTDDWLNVFSAYAEKATSERMQKHWASILAGEVRSPGSFSFATLHVMAILDPQLARVLSKVKGRMMDDGLYSVPSVNIGPEYTDLVSLQALGLVSMSHTKTFEPPKGGYAVMYEVGNIPLFVKYTKTLRLNCSLITRAGMEILSILPASGDRVFAEQVRDFWISHGAEWASLDHPPTRQA